MSILQKTVVALVIALIPADAADVQTTQLESQVEYYKAQAKLNIDLLIYKISKAAPNGS